MKIPKHKMLLAIGLWSILGIVLSPIIYLKLIYHFIYNYINDLERPVPLVTKSDISTIKTLTGVMCFVLSLIMLPVATIFVYIMVFIVLYKYMVCC